MRRDFQSLARQVHDVLIIGGGITGSCIARDAAMRGLKVALVEKKDFSHATSAANSKLVHGGLRYLKNFELGLVRESLRERRIWQRIAPHLVYPLPFLIPQPKDGKGTFTLKLGLTLYDWLSFDRKWLDDPDQRLPGHRTVKTGELSKRANIAIESGYPSAIEYFDCQMYAPERLGLCCLQDAVARGARIANYAEALAILKEPDGRVRGARVKDLETGAEIEIAARVTINAAGPWADKVMAMAEDGTASHPLVRAKGIHLITRALTDGAALAMFVGSGHFFVLPWRGHSILGTTDDLFEGYPDGITPTDADIEKMLAAVNTGLPSAKLTRADVLHAYAGARPLVDDAPKNAKKGGSYKRSRRAELIDHYDEGEPGLISALGGKWTTSRHVAAEAVDLIEEKLERRPRRAPTDRTPVGGLSTGNFRAFVARKQAENRRVDPEIVTNLARNYGTAIDVVVTDGNGDGKLLERLGNATTDCGAQVLHAVRREMARTLEDVVFRRTGIGTLGHPGEAVIARCADLMAREMRWSGEERTRQMDAVLAQFHWSAP